jgi:hypothetical protein
VGFDGVWDPKSYPLPDGSPRQFDLPDGYQHCTEYAEYLATSLPLCARRLTNLTTLRVVETGDPRYSPPLGYYQSEVAGLVLRTRRDVALP